MTQQQMLAQAMVEIPTLHPLTHMQLFDQLASVVPGPVGKGVGGRKVRPNKKK